MNIKPFIFIVLIISLGVILHYNIFNSSPELLEAVKYQNTITDLVNVARQDAENSLSKQFIEQFDDVVVTINEKNYIKVYLFYSSACPHCQNFYPIWKQTKELLDARLIECKEFESYKDKTVFREYGISGVPTIVVINANGERNIIQGELSSEDLISKLRAAGVPVNNRSEDFTDYITAAQLEAEGSDMKSDDPDCPYMSFYEGEKNYYCASSNYLTGCVNASPGSGTNSFDGAYSIVSAYLTSLPDSTIDKKKKCMAKHSEILRPWGLCDPARLAQKAAYSDDVNMGAAKERVLRTNYGENKEVVEAVLYGCSSQPIAINTGISGGA